MKHFFLIVSIIMTNSIMSQSGLQWESLSVPFQQNGNALISAGHNGLSTPQYSKFDVNQDGLEDIFIFDRTDGEASFFIAAMVNEELQFAYDPSINWNHLGLHNWVLLRDYNCDGIKDIFTAGLNNIRVCKVTNDNNEWQFDWIEEPLSSNGIEIIVAQYDIPGIHDINGDGLLDILTFSSLGGVVEWFIRLGPDCETLSFNLANDCWGGFYESGIDVEVELDHDCDEGLASIDSDIKKSRHPGSTLCLFDQDGNGANDLLLGDVSFNRLNLLTNGGFSNEAIITEQDPIFPFYDVTLDLKSFPAAYYLDVSGDELGDIIVAPNAGGSKVEDLYNNWFYKNIGTAENHIFQLQTNQFLVADMVEVGSRAFPTFVDENNDGLLDLIISNEGSTTFNEEIISSLWLYRNMGTATVPVFDFITNDYLGLSSRLLQDLIPDFGDMDGDGDDDLVIGTSGEATGQNVIDGTVIYFENIADSDAPLNFGPQQLLFADIDVDGSSAPCIVDVNEDGLMDLVIGERFGLVNYYERTGDNNTFEFDLIGGDNALWGGINVKNIEDGTGTGHAMPVVIDLDNNGTKEIIVGSELQGKLKVFTDIEDNLYDGVFTELEELTSPLPFARFQKADFADINNDGTLDAVIGNEKGGIGFYSLALDNGMAMQEIEVQNIVMQQTAGKMVLSFDTINQYSKASFISIQGSILQTVPIDASFVQFQTAQLHSGLYFVVLETVNHSDTSVIKFVIE